MTGAETSPSALTELTLIDAPTGFRWHRLHAWPMVCLLVILVTGMAYSIFWDPLFHHVSSWRTPSDLWETFRTAQYVVWGGEGQIYNNPAHFQTFPGIAMLFAPIAKLAGVFHMSESFPLNLVRPSAWLLLGPVELVFGAVLLFPLDELARRLSVSAHRRILLLCLEAVLIWPSVTLWGHPEDALALAFGVYGLMAAFDTSWFRAGAFFALAVAMQPLTLLIVPVALAYIPVKRWPLFSGEIVLPSLLLLLPPLIQEWGPTTQTLLNQPNFPLSNHPTPWFSVAPILHSGHTAVVYVANSSMLNDGVHSLAEVARSVYIAPVVAAGPGRIIGLAISGLIGLAVAVLKPSISRTIWLVAVALSLRCLFEPVVVPYYLLPGLALGLVAASTNGKTRFALAILAAAACTLLSYRYFDPWTYFVAMAFSLSLMMFFAWPRDRVATSKLPAESV